MYRCTKQVTRAELCPRLYSYHWLSCRTSCCRGCGFWWRGKNLAILIFNFSYHKFFNYSHLAWAAFKKNQMSQSVFSSNNLTNYWDLLRPNPMKLKSSRTHWTKELRPLTDLLNGAFSFLFPMDRTSCVFAKSLPCLIVTWAAGARRSWSLPSYSPVPHPEPRLNTQQKNYGGVDWK